MESPDRWLLVKIIIDDAIVVRILGGWWGGYLGADYWRLSSGIVAVQKEGNRYIAKTESGNMYSIGKGNYGVTGLSAQILNKLKSEASTENSGISLSEFEHNIGLSYIESLTLNSERFYNEPELMNWDRIEGTSEEPTDLDF